MEFQRSFSTRRTQFWPLQLLGLVVLAGCRDPLSPGAPTQLSIQAAVDRVYDTSFLHHVSVVIDPAHVPTVEQRTETRVPATVTFDGVTVRNVGVRQTGSTIRPFVTITNKPSLSLEFNEFVKGQRLHGVEKIILKNELQDLSLVNEHLTYEVFRRAGLAAPMTAHAVVTINGVLSGIYLMREAIDKDFLRRNFGDGNEEGNLYEQQIDAGRNFIAKPMLIDLKREAEEGRSRADIIALAEAVSSSTPETFTERVGKLVDLDRYIRYHAVEVATSYMDGFSFNANNTYLYFHPRDGRMVMLPWGADETFWATRSRVTRLTSPTQAPINAASVFLPKIRTVPGFQEAVLAEFARIGQPPIWDQAALLERVAQAGRNFATAERIGRTAVDIERFERFRPTVEAFIRAGGTTNGTSQLPTPPSP